MTRRTVPITVDHLAEVGEPCRSCLFWELDAVNRARLDHDERIAEKQQWLSTVLREWGSCGRVVLVDGRVAGHAIYVPAAFVPGQAALPTAPVSADAVVLTTVQVEPWARGGGLGRLLVQGMARDLVTRGQVAVEAFGDTRGSGGRLRDAGGVPRPGGLQDPARARDHPADADGAPLGDHLEGRGGGGAGEAVGRGASLPRPRPAAAPDPADAAYARRPGAP